MSATRVSVIVLAYGTEPYLAECVGSALATTTAEVEVIVVDNGASAAVATLALDSRMRVERAPHNLGYAGGCVFGASCARGDTLVFLNSDAIVEPAAIDRLVTAANQPGVGLASGDVRLAARPEIMNTVGNPVHFLGVVWAGGYGEPAAEHATSTDVATASG
ncbi:MAG TPA: glycosyltransferase family 2 protein, partial [Jatrophihabitans sp.]